MKILCATDFSQASVNAIDWAFNLLKDMEGGELFIVHCVDVIRRADMFVAIDDLLKEKAVDDMAALEKKFVNPLDKISVHTSVHKAYTKTFIPNYAKKNEVDLIVTGTTGLSSLKDIVVGSVTDHLVKHADTPILTIPANALYNGIRTVVMGLGKEQLSSTENLDTLYAIMEDQEPRIFLTQVHKPEEHTISVDLRIEDALKDLTYEYQMLEKDESVTNTLNAFCKKVDADILCMIHYRRHWLGRLVHKSVTKEELFVIERPLLIIPD